jgi:hypothetical protein
MRALTTILSFVLVLGACNGGGGGRDDVEDGDGRPDLPPDTPPDPVPDDAVPDGEEAPPDTPTDELTDEELAPCTAEPWAFTTVSDSYSGLEGGLQAALRAAFANNPDLKFIVSTGDFENNDVIDAAIQADLLSYFPGREVVPWFMAIGNHNVEDPADMTFVVETIGERLATQLDGMTNLSEGPSTDAEDWTGPHTTYSFDYRNAHFVILNQYLGSTAEADGHPLACPWTDLYDWLEADLAANVQPFIFVFGHEPFWPREDESNHCGDSMDDQRCPGNTAPPPDEWKFIRPERDRFWQLLVDHNVTAFFDGHTHQSAARAVRGITDFPMEGCIDTEWNCYCDIESEVPEVATGTRLTPADGVVDFNNGITMADGPVNIIRVHCERVDFGIYQRNDPEDTLAPLREFIYTP